MKPKLLGSRKMFANAAKGASAGGALGYSLSYLAGEADAKVPTLSKGKLKKNKDKKAPTIQRATIIGGLGAGAAYGLLKKK